MDSFAKMKTAIGALLISISLAGCGSSSYYADYTVENRYQPANSVVGVIYNWGKHTAYSVPKKDRAQHENCIYFALENAQIGESCKWRGEGNASNGSVKVVAIYPNTCHDLMSTVWFRGKSASWVDRACLKGNGWQFFSGTRG